MLGRSRWLAVCAAMGLGLAFAAAPARADGVAVADLYAELDLRDEAGATTLLVRSMLDVGAGSVVSRGDLQAAVARAGGVGYALFVHTDQIKAVAADVGATHIVTGSVRREGTRLAAMVKVYDARGAAAGMFRVDAPDGDVTGLAKAITGRVAELTGADWRQHPTGSAGQLRPFVRAGTALLRDDVQSAADALRVADTLTAGRVQAARHITEAVWRNSKVAAADRMRTAIVGVDAKAAIELGGRGSKKPDVLALRARARLLSLDLGGAADALDEVKQRRPSPPVLLARAELAHRQGKTDDRNDVLAPLLGETPYLPALPVVAAWPPASLGDELEGRALAAAEWAASRHPRLATALGLRAARGEFAAERALKLVSIAELDDAELALVQPVVDTAVAAGWADGYRLRAELAMRKGDVTAALADVQKLLEVAPGHARGELYLGRLLLEQGKLDEALAALERAAAAGEPAAKRARVAALVDAGRATEATLDDDTSVAGLRARAARLQADGKHDAAVEALRAAVRLDPNDPKGQRLLADAYRLAGDDKAAAAADAIAARNEKLLGAHAAATRDTADDKPNATQAAVADEREAELARLANELHRLLDAFPGIAERRVKRLVLVPLSGSGEPFYMPRQVDPDRLRDGLERALSTAPYKMTVTIATAEPMTEPLSVTALNEIAQTDRADGVLLYRVRADGKAAKVKLSLFEVGSQTAYDVQDVIANATSMGIVVWNRIFLAALAALGIALLGWFVLVVIRGTGELNVRVKMDPAAENEAVNVIVSRKKKRPPVGDPKDFAQRYRRGGHKKSRFASYMAGAMNEFSSIPTGRWWVHVVGVFEKGQEHRVLGDEATKRVRVRRKQANYVDFDLVPTYAEYVVHVFDGHDALSGANVWIDDDVADKVATNRDGEVVVHVPRGTHILRIDTGTMKIEKRLAVGDTKVHHMHVNLERERKLAEVSGGLSLEVHDDGGADEMVLQRGIPDLATGSEPNVPDGAVSIPAALSPAPAAAAATEGVGMPSVSFGSAPPEAGHAATQALASPGAVPPVAGPGDRTAGGMSRYERVQELGRGAMGVVYRAKDRVLERDVALKIMTPEMRQHPTALQFFLQEAKALAQLNHPNVVTVFDQGQDGADAFMVMEFVEGTTLEDMLEGNSALPLDKALDIADQLCRGLAYAHGRKVIHRDIKPANIFVSGDGIVKLGDFGLARVVHELKIQRTEVRGTPLYMAPEQIRGVDIDHRADLYAVGCTMFELVTGRPPFIEGEVLYHHLHTEPQAPSSYASSVPRELDRLILKCIRKEQDARVASADGIRESLKSIRQRYG